MFLCIFVVKWIANRNKYLWVAKYAKEAATTICKSMDHLPGLHILPGLPECSKVCSGMLTSQLKRAWLSPRSLWDQTTPRSAVTYLVTIWINYFWTSSINKVFCGHSLLQLSASVAKRDVTCSCAAKPDVLFFSFTSVILFFHCTILFLFTRISPLLC